MWYLEFFQLRLKSCDETTYMFSKLTITFITFFMALVSSGWLRCEKFQEKSYVNLYKTERAI